MQYAVSAAELRSLMGMTNASKFKKNKQRYVLTDAGRELLDNNTQDNK